jgi:hypothetical protein
VACDFPRHTSVARPRPLEFSLTFQTLVGDVVRRPAFLFKVDTYNSALHASFQSQMQFLLMTVLISGQIWKGWSYVSPHGAIAISSALTQHGLLGRAGLMSVPHRVRLAALRRWLASEADGAMAPPPGTDGCVSDAQLRGAPDQYCSGDVSDRLRKFLSADPEQCRKPASGVGVWRLAVAGLLARAVRAPQRRLEMWDWTR